MPILCGFPSSENGDLATPHAASLARVLFEHPGKRAVVANNPPRRAQPWPSPKTGSNTGVHVPTKGIRLKIGGPDGLALARA
jgi:hypothetical protein